MRRLSVLPALLAFGSLALVSCADDSTQPNPVGEQLAEPELALVTNTWRTRRDMPFEVWYTTSAMVRNAADQSILYVVGGAGSPYGFSVDRVQAYNVATNTWSQKARLPYPLYASNGTGVINGKIYFSGGYYDDGEDWGPSGFLFVYDPATNRWNQKAYMPEAGSHGVTGVIQGRLYVVSTCYERIPLEYELGWCSDVEGGRPGVSNFFRYNPVANRWARLPSPNGEYHMGGVVDKKLYVTDGKKLEAYDPVTNRWTTRASGPQVRYRAAVTEQGSKLYLIGGRQLTSTGWQTVRTTRVYNPTTNTWTNAAPMPTARQDITASKVFLNGQPRIEVVGGSPPGNNLQYIP
jgi:N-acetylneuraminic acid mutarotase